MEFSMNLVYHKYIMKVVLFSVFLYKSDIRKPDIYKENIILFVKKRVGWKISLVIDTGKRLSKQEERSLFLDEILNDIKTDYMSSIMVSFTTPLKRVIMLVDLKQQEKYEKFIYS